jgi:Fur family ferric uptake transcriptional regulator
MKKYLTEMPEITSVLNQSIKRCILSVPETVNEGEYMKVRSTKQKQLIISILKESERPLSINELYNKIILELPRIAKSTIYRNIDLLLEQNLIEKYHFKDNEIFYFYKGDDEHKHFILCDGCKKIYNLPSCPLKEIEDYIEKEGFIIKDHQIQITGICKSCAPKNTK